MVKSELTVTPNWSNALSMKITSWSVRVGCPKDQVP